MQIDEQVEDRVRKAFGAVIDRDGDAMVRALEGLDEQQAATALWLALYAVGYVVNDVYRDGVTGEGIRVLANQIVSTESGWITLDTDTVTRLLGAAAKGDSSLGGVPREDVAGTAFVSGGHLLGAFSADGEPWWQYLDAIWAALEAVEP